MYYRSRGVSKSNRKQGERHHQELHKPRHVTFWGAPEPGFHSNSEIQKERFNEI